MATVEVIHDRAVRVTHDKVTAQDVIELAEVLIQEDGWRQTESGNSTVGWSIHGAIGEAARLVGEYDETTRSYGGKDGPKARPLRDEATNLLAAVLPSGETEYTFNDKADNVDAVLALMRSARGA